MRWEETATDSCQIKLIPNITASSRKCSYILFLNYLNYTQTPSFNTNSKFCFYPCFPVHYKTSIFGFHFTTALFTHAPMMAWKCECQGIISKNILWVKTENIAQPGIFHRYRLCLYKHVSSNNQKLSTTLPHFWVGNWAFSRSKISVVPTGNWMPDCLSHSLSIITN
jgi:hypothetical protein